MDIYILLFDQFQTLDVFGPVEVLGRVKEFNLHFCSYKSGLITGCQHVPVMTEIFNIGSNHSEFILLIPGGVGTRSLVNMRDEINFIRRLAEYAKYCLTICTGSAVLAKTGLLNNKKATSNKIAWPWVISMNSKVNWQYHARWCKDEKYYTSAGVSAGTDMALGFVSDLYGQEYATEIARTMEYNWNDNANLDFFALK